VADGLGALAVPGGGTNQYKASGPMVCRRVWRDRLVHGTFVAGLRETAVGLT
jgi:hypothetical protein